jgi:hypothetical protein
MAGRCAIARKGRSSAATWRIVGLHTIGLPVSHPVESLFEKELSRRGVQFRRELETGRYFFTQQAEILVSLENLKRECGRDFDASLVVKFVDSVLSASFASQSWEEVRHSILFCLEPTDYLERPELRTSISNRVDRVPVQFDPAKGTIVWVTRTMLDEWEVSLKEVEAAAADNLAATLAGATVRHQDIDGVRLASFETALPFKSAMIVAPNLKEVISPVLGWPLYAVIPDRSFLYLWSTQHTDFIERVGAVVVDEFTKSPYPITTEVLEISDGAIKAVADFPIPPDPAERESAA